MNIDIMVMVLNMGLVILSPCALIWLIANMAE